MDRLDLAWDTFDFYTAEIAMAESVHLNIVNTINNFLNKEEFPKKHQRNRLKKKCLNNLDNLLVLYKKQLLAIEDLLCLKEDIVDIPSEKEIDENTMLLLKNITMDLIEEMSNGRDVYSKLLS